MQLVTLGALDLRDGDRHLLPGRRKPLALLAWLARHPGRGHRRAELAAMLWGRRDEGAARQSLRQALSELRPALGDVLRAEPDVTLDRGAVALDVAALEQHIARSAWGAAIEACRGDFLPGCDDLGDDRWRSWIEGEREALRRHLAMAVEQEVLQGEREGNWTMVIARATLWMERIPTDERAALHLIPALRATGRDAEAAATLARFIARLEGESVSSPDGRFATSRVRAPRRRPSSRPARGRCFPPTSWDATARCRPSRAPAPP